MSVARRMVKAGAHQAGLVHSSAACADRNPGAPGSMPPSWRPGPTLYSRRGMMLLVVLVIITVLAVLGASFSFRMSADLASVNAKQELQQARMATESGIDRVIALLRDKRNDLDEWYNNQRAFRRILVWSPDKIGGSESLADQELIPGRPAWRFSIVSYKIEGNTARVRYGITDEASKVNLNAASRMQLLALFDQLPLEDVTSEELADALIDWRDKDDEPISGNGAESNYYMTLDPPYKAKNKPLETVEELLMVKGFDGQILYGEDYNRNGYLDINEDDGPEGAFPPDNGDGILERGLLPYVMVYSWDWNLGNDNKRRLDINRENFEQLDKLPQHVVTDINPAVLDFIAQAKKRGYKFKSVGELVGLQVFEDGTSNYDKAWRKYRRELQQAGKPRQNADEESDRPLDEADSDGGSDGNMDSDGVGQQNGGNNSDSEGDEERPRTGRRRTARDRNQANNENSNDSRRGNDTRGGSGQGGNQNSDDEDDEDNASGTRGKPNNRANQSIRNNNSDDDEEEENTNTPRNGGNRRGGNRNSDGASSNDEGDSQDGSGTSGNSRDRRRNRNRAGGGNNNQDGNSDSNDNTDQQGGGGNRNNNAGRGNQGNNGNQNPDELDEEDQDENGAGSNQGGGRSRGTPITSPVSAADLDILLDRLTANPLPAMAGLVNVNTASAIVLQTVPGLDAVMADAIVAKRTQLSGQDKLTPAWLISSGAVDAMTFAIVSNQLTSRSIQFTIDAIGFADHVGAAKRIQAVVEMRGQLSQIKYYRDITSLGIGFPIRDDERSEGFAFSDE